jgi:peptidoglycan hydrolase-like protein with peptidoglycan-binding domain
VFTRILRVLLASAIVVSVLAISRPEPASAYTTIFYNGAGRAPHIGLIGDSTLAATRWYGRLGALKRYNFVLDAESCRRTTHTSCRGREGYAPENTLTVMRRLEGRWGRVLVLMTGYDDPGSTFGDAIDAVMREAIRQGIPRVMWLTFRTADVSYVGPTFNSDLHTFRDNNKLLLQKALKYGGRLQIANWARYSARHPEWVTSDGVHLTAAGTDAVTEFIADNVAKVLAGRTITPPRPNIPACRTGVVMRERDRLNDVRCLERHLDSLGFDLTVDTWYGPRTAAAVEFLDYARSWPRDGIATRRVTKAVGAYRKPTAPPWCSTTRQLRQGDRGLDVRCLIRALHARGYLLDRGAKRFGPSVADAVSHFRRNQGLRSSRIAGSVTLSRLGIFRPTCRISAALAPGATGPPVRCLRRFLIGRGSSIQPVGPYNARMATAVRSIERRRDLPVDGVADEQFLRVIGAWRS